MCTYFSKGTGVLGGLVNPRFLNLKSRKMLVLKIPCAEPNANELKQKT